MSGHGQALTEARPARPAILIMIVGIFRSEQCGHASFMENVVSANPHLSFHTVVCTDPTTRCSSKHPYGCNKPAGVASMTSSITSLYPTAKISFASNSNYASRSKRCLELGLESYRHHHLAAALLVRPDVIWTRPVNLSKYIHSKPAFNIIQGYNYRPCIFSNRDFDFGFLAAPPNAMRTWLGVFTTSATEVEQQSLLNSRQAALPAGIIGEWHVAERGEEMSAASCGKNLTLSRNQTLHYERWMRALEQAGTPMSAVRETALSIVAPYVCDAIYAPSESPHPQAAHEHLVRLLHPPTEATQCLLRRQAERHLMHNITQNISRSAHVEVQRAQRHPEDLHPSGDSHACCTDQLQGYGSCTGEGLAKLPRDAAAHSL